MNKYDGFREAVLTFKDTGSYCKYPKGSRSYKKFWEQETDRCLNGYNLGWDNIPGYYYFYLNYSRIQIVKPRVDSKGIIIYNPDGTVQGDRTEDFANWWDGDYKYFHYLEEAEKGGKHGVVLKARGKGYSFKGGSMLNRNYFLLRGSKSYALAAEKEYLIKDGLLTKAWEMMSFIDTNTAWSKRRQFVNLPMHKRASYESSRDGIKTEAGYKSEIIGITLKNDANRARGKRGKLMLFEEGGKFPALLQAWNISRDSMEQGNIVQGLMVAYGTGGTEGADFSSLQEMFDNPKGYNILPVNNIWDEGKETTECGFFVPDYMNLEGFMTPDGESKVPEALVYIEKDRKIVLENTRDTTAYKRRCAEHPITTREAMMNLDSNLYPTHDLLGVLARLETDPEYEKSITKCRLIIDEDGIVDIKEDKTLRVIYNFPTRKEDNLNAPVVIYELPVKQTDGTIPRGIYIGAIDPYDFDHGTSLGSILIINKLTNRVVAEYTARPNTADEFYEQCRRLLMFYNAKALYENEKKGIFTYFEKQGSLYLLNEEPGWLGDIIKTPGVSRKYGIRMPEPVKRYGEGMIYQWLIKDYDKENNVKNYHKIRSIGLLKELCSYNKDKGNFDRHSALICLMYQLETERRYTPITEDTPVHVPMHQKGIFGRSISRTDSYESYLQTQNKLPNIFK